MRRTKSRRQSVAVLVVMLGALGGCTSITKHIGERPANSVKQLATQYVHYHQILDALGPPEKISSLPDGFAFEYESFRIDERQLGLSPDVQFLRWFKLAYGTARVRRETHTLVFDHSGHLKAYGHARVDHDAGKGLAFQFIVTVTQVVDTSYLEESAGQHAWGMSMLQPLPVALNREQSLDSGEHGVEQRGTPTFSGQRTLEWR